jgi:predicted AlkP superfamily pyrophosphatase or phosphodiesterase
MMRVLVILWLLACMGSPAAAEVTRPRLVVIISVDQFRGDYVDRYGHQWTRGLRRLFDRGAYFPLTAFPYMNTVTCAGHATISTGTFPATHGIPLNAWWDREQGKQMSCTQDPAVQLVLPGQPGAAPAGHSAWRLRVPTFADELRLQSPVPPRIVTMSNKQRSAIMLAGHRGDLVTWYDGERGFVTSTAYTPGPMPFLEQFQRAQPIAADAGRTWERTRPPSEYLFTDDATGEKHVTWSRTFPHQLPGAPGRPDKGFYTLWEDTPFPDAYLARMAAAAVKEFTLGRGNGTDYLGVSFSALDNVGHDFGPRSHEVQDVLMSLDATLGQLLDELDRQVGPGAYVVALTADHGVSLIPEQVAEEGLSAGRIAGDALVERLNAALAPWAATLGPGPYVETLIYTDLYFKRGIYQHLLDTPEAMRAVRLAIESTPGVHRVLQSDDIAAVRLGTDQLSLTALQSYAPGRSGDLLIVPRPYFLNSTAATTHGTGYRYDARVPLVFAGPGIKPGRYAVASTPADVVPTLAYLVGITMSRADGRVLQEALAPAEAAENLIRRSTSGRAPDAPRTIADRP